MLRLVATQSWRCCLQGVQAPRAFRFGPGHDSRVVGLSVHWYNFRVQAMDAAGVLPGTYADLGTGSGALAIGLAKAAPAGSRVCTSPSKLAHCLLIDFLSVHHPLFGLDQAVACIPLGHGIVEIATSSLALSMSARLPATAWSSQDSWRILLLCRILVAQHL